MPTKGRGDNTSRFDNDNTDMMRDLKKQDVNSANLSKFLFDAHGKMPPSFGFEVNSEHLFRLIVKVSTLKERLTELDKKRHRHENSNSCKKHDDIRDTKLKLAEYPTSPKNLYPIGKNQQPHQRRSDGKKKEPESNVRKVETHPTNVQISLL